MADDYRVFTPPVAVPTSFFLASREQTDVFPSRHAFRDTLTYNDGSGPDALLDNRKDHPFPVSYLPFCGEGDQQIQPVSRFMPHNGGFFSTRGGASPSQINVAGAIFAGGTGRGPQIAEPTSSFALDSAGFARNVGLHGRGLTAVMVGTINPEFAPENYPGLAAPLASGLRIEANDFPEKTEQARYSSNLNDTFYFIKTTADWIRASTWWAYHLQPGILPIDSTPAVGIWRFFIDFRKLRLKYSTGAEPFYGDGASKGGSFRILQVLNEDFRDLDTQQFMVHFYLDSQLLGTTF